jgi:hypothetical protein
VPQRSLIAPSPGGDPHCLGPTLPAGDSGDDRTKPSASNPLILGGPNRLQAFRRHLFVATSSGARLRAVPFAITPLGCIAFAIAGDCGTRRHVTCDLQQNAQQGRSGENAVNPTEVAFGSSVSISDSALRIASTMSASRGSHVGKRLAPIPSHSQVFPHHDLRATAEFCGKSAAGRRLKASQSRARIDTFSAPDAI